MKQAPDLFVSDVLAAPPLVRQVAVRTIAPAFILVCEVDAPLRFVSSASNRAEAEALHHWLSTSPDGLALCRVWSDSRANVDGGEDLEVVAREQAHSARLKSAPVSSSSSRTP